MDKVAAPADKVAAPVFSCVKPVCSWEAQQRPRTYTVGIGFEARHEGIDLIQLSF